MKTMNFKHLDTSAYKYFWEELKKIHFHGLSEADFLRGGVIVHPDTQEPYQFDKQQSKESDFEAYLDFFLTKGGQLLVFKDGPAEPITLEANDYETVLMRSFPLILITDVDTGHIKTLILAAYKNTSCLLWSSDLVPFELTHLWHPLESFKKIEWLESQLSKRSFPPLNWVSFLTEEDFNPSEEVSRFLEVSNATTYINVSHGAFYFEIENLNLRTLKEIDKKFSHFEYEVFIPDRFLLEAEDGWYKVFINKKSK